MKVIEPWLACDSHYGVYMHQLVYEHLDPYFRDQLEAKMASHRDLLLDPNSDDSQAYWKACEDFENVVFESPEGLRFSLVSNEDLWWVPEDYDLEGWFI